MYVRTSTDSYSDNPTDDEVGAAAGRATHDPTRLGEGDSVKDPGNDRITEIQEILGLTQVEVAALFGVRLPTLARWQAGDIPARRRASIDRLYEFALVLQRQFIPSRIGHIVRTPAAGLGDRTILQVIQCDGVGPIYKYLEHLFAYGNA